MAVKERGVSVIQAGNDGAVVEMDTSRVDRLTVEVPGAVLLDSGVLELKKGQSRQSFASALTITSSVSVIDGVDVSSIPMMVLQVTTPTASPVSLQVMWYGEEDS